MKTTLRCLRAAVCVAGLAVAGYALDEDKKPVPLYTNEDLRRVSPYRDQTGASSTTAVEPAAVAPTPAKSRARGEDYWRREADRLRDRLRPLRERAAELQLTIEERRLRVDDRRRRSSSRVAVTAPVAALEQRLRLLEERIREAESRLEDRARREGALPGWLR